MATVWIQMRESAEPTKVLGDDQFPGEVAVYAMDLFARDWTLTKKGRTAKKAPHNGLERILYFSDGKPAGSLFVEILQPPSSPDAGEHYVSRSPA